MGQHSQYLNVSLWVVISHQMESFAVRGNSHGEKHVLNIYVGSFHLPGNESHQLMSLFLLR